MYQLKSANEKIIRKYLLHKSVETNQKFTVAMQQNWKTVCYYHVTYEFQSESTLYGCLNVKTNTQPFSQTGQFG